MLEYILNSDGSSYEVVGETDKSLSRIVIPDTYNGLPVTSVSALFDSFPNLTEIVFGNNVERTSYGTLDIATLERIYFGRAIFSVSGPFYECEKLSNIYYSGTKEQWEQVNIVTVDDSITIFKKAKIHYGVLGCGGFLTYQNETLFPYTHWDCVKGKPESIGAEKISYDNSISGIDADNVKAAIDELNAKSFDSSSLQSWDELMHLVRSGKAREYISIGDEFVCKRGDEELSWTVIGIDEDTPSDTRHTHSITLQLSECYTSMPYGYPEAAYYCFNALDAGKYYIGLKNYESGKRYFSFTLDEALPADSLIRISSNRVFFYKDRYSNPYKAVNADSVTNTADGLEGTELENANYRIHNNMGTLDYTKSDLRYWLNSEKSDWWVSDTIFSLKPTKIADISGFLKGMDSDFLNAVNPVVKKLVLANGTETEINDKFFIPSTEEVYADGKKPYSFYKENSSLTSSGKSADTARMKTLDGSATDWWLRNCESGDIGLTKVSQDGSVVAFESSGEESKGILPTCCIC